MSRTTPPIKGGSLLDTRRAGRPDGAENWGIPRILCKTYTVKGPQFAETKTHKSSSTRSFSRSLETIRRKLNTASSKSLKSGAVEARA